MLDKDDFVSRKVRAYLKEAQGYEDKWYLYGVMKDTLFYDEWPVASLSTKEAKALAEAMDDWQVYTENM
jgi:hypothetical protein